MSPSRPPRTGAAAQLSLFRRCTHWACAAQDVALGSPASQPRDACGGARCRAPRTCAPNPKAAEVISQRPLCRHRVPVGAPLCTRVRPAAPRLRTARYQLSRLRRGVLPIRRQSALVLRSRAAEPNTLGAGPSSPRVAAWHRRRGADMPTRYCWLCCAQRRGLRLALTLGCVRI